MLSVQGVIYLGVYSTVRVWTLYTLFLIQGGARIKPVSNMGYCRFRNTLIDLRDCAEHLNDELGQDEAEARKRLVRLCQKIINDFVEDE